MKQTFRIIADATSSMLVSSQLGHIENKLSESIKLEGKLSDYQIQLDSLILPYTVPTISSTKANHQFRYNYNSTGDNTITFDDGIYTPDYITSTVEATLLANGHYYTDGYGEKQPYFSLKFNHAIGKAYFEYYDSTTYPVTIDFPATTFYEVIGFLVGDSITNDAVGTNRVDLSQGEDEFFLWCNVVSGNYNNNVGTSRILYSSMWNSAPQSYNRFPNTNETAQPMSAPLNTSMINTLEFKIMNRNNEVMSFPTSAQTDAISITVSIVKA